MKTGKPCNKKMFVAEYEPGFVKFCSKNLRKNLPIVVVIWAPTDVENINYIFSN